MLTEEDEKLLKKLAEFIVRWHLVVPAIFFLEMSKPLSFVGSQFLVVMGPLMHCFFPEKQYDRFTELFSHRENVEYFLTLVEKEDSKTH